MKAAALEYARSGIHVFPCRPNDKRPITKRGLHDATINADDIDAWWTARPDANIGIATGASELVVIDIDVKNGSCGWRGFDACLRDIGQLPGPTRMVSTPSGGAHIYFRGPKGATIRNSASRLAPGVDVRAAGGYVVAPPSTIEGKCYRWDITERAQVLPQSWVEAMAPAPVQATPPPHPCERPVIPDRGEASRYGRAVINSEADAVRKAERGSRNDTVTRSAFRVGRIADACGITTGQVEEMFAWAVSYWGDDREAIKARDSFFRAFQAGQQAPRRVQWSK